MLTFNLKAVLQARQIQNPYSFLVKIGIAPHTATRILNSQTHVMRLNHIELICKNLHCEPNDLLVFTNDPKNPLPQNHPLTNLIQKQHDNNWQETLKTIPLKQLQEIATIINKTQSPQQ